MYEIENQQELVDKGYRGNRNLRKSGVQQEWTKDQLIEWKRCHDDPIYFIRSYMKIVHIDHGIIPFDLWDFQEKLITDLHNNRLVMGLWPRQQGKSTTIAAYMLHYVLFNSNKTCAILANKATGAREILSRIQMAYELLPFWMKMGIIDWNKGSFLLENGSSILASATSSSAIRGLSCISGNSVVTVKDNDSGEIKDITVYELTLELIKADFSKSINNKDTKIFMLNEEDFNGTMDSISYNKFIKR